MTKQEFEALITQFTERLAALEDDNKRLRHTVDDVIIKSLVDSADEYDRETFLEGLNGKEGYGDTAAKMKTLYGDDYDLGMDLYDQSRDVEDKDGFIMEALADINNKLSALIPEAPVETPVETPVEEAPAEVDTSDMDNLSDEQLAAELAAAE